ncbi:MAG: hypothetical protein Q7U78_10515 [Gallionella sp.]|nr:hypothetical protein [Gallionella sp.]
MARLSNTRETLIALFAKSGNVCAFPGCNHELVTSRNIFVGQICHIEAASPGGQRYSPLSNDEARRSFENQLLLCYRHHKETDDIAAFDVHSLKDMKHEHESKHGQKPFKVNEAFLHRLESEMEAYWTAIENDNRNTHVAPEFAALIPIGTPASQQFADAYLSLERLGQILADLSTKDGTLNEEIRHYLALLGYNLKSYDAVPYYENPFFNRNWETHALAVTNTCTDLIVALKQSEVRFLEEYAKTHSNESTVLQRLDTAKSELREMAVSCGYVD